MSCSSCNQVKVDGDSLPALVPASSGQAAPCNDAESSTGSEGCQLDSCLTDPKDLPCGDGMTLLGRVGSRLARFTGSGYIEVHNSLAYLTSAPLLRIRDIWAGWKQNGKIGDPLPFPYSIAVDQEGVMHALAGLEDHDSLQVWDATKGEWSVIKLSDLKKSINSALPQADNIELTGYEEVGMMDSACGQDREMKALRGNGMVYLEKTPVNDCDDPCSSEVFAYVAKVLEFPVPTGVETYKLQFDHTGLKWVQE